MNAVCPWRHHLECFHMICGTIHHMHHQKTSGLLLPCCHSCPMAYGNCRKVSLTLSVPCIFLFETLELEGRGSWSHWKYRSVNVGGAHHCHTFGLMAHVHSAGRWGMQSQTPHNRCHSFAVGLAWCAEPSLGPLLAKLLPPVHQFEHLDVSSADGELPNAWYPTMPKRSKRALTLSWRQWISWKPQHLLPASLPTAASHGALSSSVPPWWGGFYERLVGMVKRCLNKILGKASLKMMELITVLNEIEAILNSRPLTYPYSDINDGPPLTPSHFLCGYRLMSLPSPHEPSQEKYPDHTPTESSKEILTSKARYHARLIDRFWSIWRREYLTDLREFHSRYIKGKRVSKESNITVGDIVLVHDNLPRYQWRLATVTRVIPSSKDGLVRAASLRVSNGNEIRRPIEKLYPLEISEDSDQTMATPKVDEPAIKGARPNPRESATRARLKIKQQAVARSDLNDWELYSSRLSNTCGI